MQKIISVLTVAAIACSIAACGHDTTQRAATGAIGGAVVAGPVGAVVGGVGGAAVSKANGEK
jgi:osmotically inducible lipoprotein OsmB